MLVYNYVYMAIIIYSWLNNFIFYYFVVQQNVQKLVLCANVCKSVWEVLRWIKAALDCDSMNLIPRVETMTRLSGAHRLDLKFCANFDKLKLRWLSVSRWAAALRMKFTLFQCLYDSHFERTADWQSVIGNVQRNILDLQ